MSTQVTMVQETRTELTAYSLLTLCLAGSMREVRDQVDKVARWNTSVLITGETGVGKGIVAKALHEQSSRNDGPFLVFDCSSQTRELIGAELFGHARGAFTGAYADRVGFLEAAHRGTLFLDEIGELPIELQPRLLRAMERGSFQRVGSTNPVTSDFRLVVASSRELTEMAAQRLFRQDLLYRLNTFTIAMPPLRERTEDILPLAHHFLAEFSEGRAVFTGESEEALLSHNWLGNVRELRNCVERAVILSGSQHISVEHLQLGVNSEDGAGLQSFERLAEAIASWRDRTGVSCPELLCRLEWYIVQRAAQKFQGRNSIRKVSEQLQICRRSLYNIMKGLGSKRQELQGVLAK